MRKTVCCMLQPQLSTQAYLYSKLKYQNEFNDNLIYMDISKLRFNKKHVLYDNAKRYLLKRLYIMIKLHYFCKSIDNYDSYSLPEYLTNFNTYEYFNILDTSITPFPPFEINTSSIHAYDLKFHTIKFVDLDGSVTVKKYPLVKKKTLLNVNNVANAVDKKKIRCQAHRLCTEMQTWEKQVSPYFVLRI